MLGELSVFTHEDLKKEESFENTKKGHLKIAKLWDKKYVQPSSSRPIAQIPQHEKLEDGPQKDASKIAGRQHDFPQKSTSREKKKMCP